MSSKAFWTLAASQVSFKTNLQIDDWAGNTCAVLNFCKNECILLVHVARVHSHIHYLILYATVRASGVHFFPRLGGDLARRGEGIARTLSRWRENRHAFKTPANDRSTTEGVARIIPFGRPGRRAVLPPPAAAATATVAAYNTVSSSENTRRRLSNNNNNKKKSCLSFFFLPSFFMFSSEIDPIKNN